MTNRSHGRRAVTVHRLARLVVASVVIAAAVAAVAHARPHRGREAMPVPTPIGVGPDFTLAAGPPAAVPGLGCTTGRRPRRSVHVELFARGRALLLPAGIGVGRPRRMAAGTVVGGRCRYPLATLDPTGTVRIAVSRTLHLGDLFRVWGQPLDRPPAVRIPLGGAGPRLPERPPLAGGGGRDPAAPARGDRGRDRAVRAAACPVRLPGGRVMRRPAAMLALVLLAAAGCGSGSGGVSLPVIAPAKQYHLSGFEPSGPVKPGQPVTVKFTVVQPSGAPLVHYRTGPGPHTGVHLIIVRDDLSTIIHRHPPIGPGGRISERVMFPAPGPYHVVVDIYPATKGPVYTNFQLTQSIHVRGRYRPQPIGAFRPVVKVRRLHLPDGPCAAPPRRSGGADPGHRHRPGRSAGHLHPLVRRAGPRDLLPPARSRLLPHPHLRARPGRLHQHRERHRVRHRRPRRACSRSACCCRPRAAPGGCSCSARSTAAS